ncbi:MAG TPA: SurA N-terminal domain-containing protein [Verrucomicrobiae bacterium]
MFSFIRRHQYLAMVFILLVIASFVIFFTDRSHLGGGESASFGSIDGRPVTRSEYMNARNEAMLTHFFRFRDWPRAGSMAEQMGWKLEQQTMERIMLARRLKEGNMIVGEEAVAKQVAQLFRGDGQTSIRDAYNNFIEQRLKPQGLTDADFRRFLQHELGGAQLGALHSSGGRLVTPAMAEAAYRFENQRVETKTVSFQATNYVAKAKVGIDPAALTQYYSNQVANYNLPTRVQVSYVTFESINYLAEAASLMVKNTNLNAIVEQIYKQRGSNSFTDEKGVILSADKAKEKIRDEARTEEASRIAQQKAYEFAAELQEMEPLSAGNLAGLAGRKGFKVFETEPFSALDGPKGIKESSQFSQQAFALNNQQPFAPEPVRSGDDFYVIAFKNRLPSMPQPFEVVKAKVEADYVQHRAMQLAREAGINFGQAVTNGLAAGKKFTDIAKEHKASVVNVAPFGRQSGAVPELESLRISPFQYRSSAFAHKAGESSGFVSSGDGGFVLLVEKFLPADETKMKSEFKEYLTTLRSRQASLVYNEWMTGQLLNAGVGSEK